MNNNDYKEKEPATGSPSILQTGDFTTNNNILQAGNAVNQPQATQPVQPVNPVDQPQTMQSVQPVNSVDQPQTMQPVQPVNPVDQPQTMQSVQPVNPVDQSQAMQPAQPVNIINQPQATQPVKPRKSRSKKKLVLIEDVQNVLTAMNITVRYNTISGQMTICGMPGIYSAENAVNVLPALIRNYFRSRDIEVAPSIITDALLVISDRNRFNPVLEMLNSTQYDGFDYIGLLDKILGISDSSLDRLLLRKWLHQTVAMALNDEAEPFGADGVLVFQGDQGDGKTLFFRILAVFSNLFAEGVSIDADNKDSIMQSTAVWISELGELDSTLKREQPRLKAFLTSSQDTYRPPYARAAIRRARRTSFCGTVNPQEFLNDETGSRRYWVIHLDHIDLKILRSLTPDWLIHMWVQVYVQYYQPDPQGFRLTPEERALLLARNKGYEKSMPGELEIVDRLNLNKPESEWIFYTTSNVMRMLDIHGVSSSQIGKILTKLAKNDPRITVKTCHNVKYYRLPPLPDIRNH